MIIGIKLIFTKKMLKIYKYSYDNRNIGDKMSDNHIQKDSYLRDFVAEMALKIREERELRRLSQTDLAAFAGVSLNFISQLESGKKTVRIDKLLAVLNALGLEVKIEYANKNMVNS
jgi:y4mF family transcriptional regulator